LIAQDGPSSDKPARINKLEVLRDERQFLGRLRPPPRRFEDYTRRQKHVVGGDQDRPFSQASALRSGNDVESERYSGSRSEFEKRGLNARNYQVAR
jgi:hypothetical protein